MEENKTGINYNALLGKSKIVSAIYEKVKELNSHKEDTRYGEWEDCFPWDYSDAGEWENR